MMEKRITVDEKLQTEKQYRYYFPKVSITNPDRAYEDAQEICDAIKFKYSCSVKIAFVSVGEISSEFSIFLIFHAHYNETVFGFLQKIKEQMLSKSWLIEQPVEVFDPINPVELPPVALPEKGSLKSIVEAVKAFYQENKAFCLLGLGILGFLMLIVVVSGRSEEASR